MLLHETHQGCTAGWIYFISPTERTWDIQRCFAKDKKVWSHSGGGYVEDTKGRTFLCLQTCASWGIYLFVEGSSSVSRLTEDNEYTGLRRFSLLQPMLLTLWTWCIDRDETHRIIMRPFCCALGYFYCRHQSHESHLQLGCELLLERRLSGSPAAFPWFLLFQYFYILQISKNSVLIESGTDAKYVFHVS